jgi:hypothetical protein
MDDGRRRAALAAWLAIDPPARFAERILPIDHAVAEHRGDLMAQSPPKRRCAVRYGRLLLWTASLRRPRSPKISRWSRAM